jgi:peptidoglycan hydrolase-like protein with peptidoglycan-binding domain/lysophospholipase L1-like esterase
MRFNEFKLLVEGAEQQYYAVGDSHAVAVAGGGGRRFWNNLAVNGTSATGSHPKIQTMLNNIDDIKPGGVVLISLGANDTAIAYKAAIDNNRAPKSPKDIANDVLGVVNKVKSKNPARIVFLLFPNGPGRTPKSDADARWYGGDYQDRVREAIKSTLSGIAIIDLNGKPLKNDGIHAQDSVYSQVAREVVADYKPKLSGDRAPSDAPGLDDPKKSAANAAQAPTDGFKIPESPTGQNYSKKSGGVSPELMDVQKVLLAMDYNVGPTGADGRFGKFTRSAIKRFQAKTPGLVVDGDAGPQTVKALNAAIAKNPEKFKNLVNSTAADIKSSAITGSKEEEVPEPDVKADTKGKVGALLDLIASPESKGNYDAVYPGKRRPAILDMTLTELLKDMARRAAQNKADGLANSGASGRYQLVSDTLRDIIKGMGIDPNKVKFTPDMQDKLIIYRLRSQRKLDAWLDDKLEGGDREFMELLAQEFAGFPAPSRNGKSYYGKDGYNKAWLTLNQVASALQDIKEQ